MFLTFVHECSVRVTAGFFATGYHAQISEQMLTVRSVRLSLLLVINVLLNEMIRKLELMDSVYVSAPLIRDT